MTHGGPFDPFAVIGGFPVGKDGRVHTTFTHNPSTLRLSSANPNMQNLPRGNDSVIQRWVKECFVAPQGSVFWARDYAAIEARLVGYFAGSRDFLRWAGLGVHGLLASHILQRPADPAWSDADLKAYFKEIKKANPVMYDTAKRVVYLSLYMGTPRKMHYEYPKDFPTVKVAADLQDLFFELAPEIRTWHKNLCLRVDGSKLREGDVETPWSLGVCTVQNPFGYMHRFYNVLDWEKKGTQWVWSYGEDAKRLVATLPQGTAAGVIKRSARTLWYDYPWVGETLRLLIHDETLGECAERDLDECLATSKAVMEAPIEELPLDPAWGMGTHMVIPTEPKVGRCWADMKEV